MGVSEGPGAHPGGRVPSWGRGEAASLLGALAVGKSLAGPWRRGSGEGFRAQHLRSQSRRPWREVHLPLSPVPQVQHRREQEPRGSHWHWQGGGGVVQVAGRPRLRGLARSPVFTAEKAASREQPRHGNERQGWGRLRGKQENDAGKGGNFQAHLSRLAQMSSRAVERCGVRTARISDPQRGSPAPRHPARGRSECEGQRAEGRRWGGGARRTRLTLRSSCAHRPPAACSPTAPGLHLASSHSFWGGESGGEWREVTQARTT